MSPDGKQYGRQAEEMAPEIPISGPQSGCSQVKRAGNLSAEYNAGFVAARGCHCWARDDRETDNSRQRQRHRQRQEPRRRRRRQLAGSLGAPIVLAHFDCLTFVCCSPARPTNVYRPTRSFHVNTRRPIKCCHGFVGAHDRHLRMLFVFYARRPVFSSSGGHSSSRAKVRV